jgi:hypothetical protein
LAIALVAIGCGGGGVSTTPDGAAGATGSAGATGTAGATGAAGTTGVKCPDFVPCGGNVVGTWAPDPTCAPATQASGGDGCTGETWDVSHVVSQPTWTFRADKTMTVALSASGFATVTTNDTCLAKNVPPVTCADAGPTYAKRISFAGGMPSSGGCVASGTDCRCTVDFTPMPVEGPGSYSLSGTTLSAKVGDSMPTTFDYCASATKLQMRRQASPGLPASDPGSYVKR